MEMLRIERAALKVGVKRSQFYKLAKEGMLPRAVSLGGRIVAWPDVELEVINRARVAGKTDDEIRALVAQLEQQRKDAA
jgi:prophage regulatory protein